MRKLLLAANWKMNKTVAQTVDFANKIKDFKSDREILICPPATSMKIAFEILKDSKIMIGAQNMHFKEDGAYTGEISPLMVKEFCTHVILGHSERRHIFGEDNVLINNKIRAALDHNLIPIFCVGETEDEHHDGKTNTVLKNQVLEGLKNINDISNIIIAYEPVWAIGTGNTATPEEAEEVHVFIRSLIERKYSKSASNKLRILYGGSVSTANAKDLLAKENIDGALIGGASLDIKKFKKIIEA